MGLSENAPAETNPSSSRLTLFRSGVNGRSWVYLALTHVSHRHAEILWNVDIGRGESKGTLGFSVAGIPCKLHQRTGAERPGEKGRTGSRGFPPNPLSDFHWRWGNLVSGLCLCRLLCKQQSSSWYFSHSPGQCSLWLQHLQWHV